MKQYHELLRNALSGEQRNDDRTGAGTVGVFQRQARFDLSDGFPLVTTKRMPFKTIARELLWFLSGDDNIRSLVLQGVPIWSSDALRSNLEAVISSGLMTRDEVEQARAKAKEARRLIQDTAIPISERIAQHDALMDPAYDLLKRYGKKWDSEQADQVALPPCHYAFQVHVSPQTKKLTVGWKQRSCDTVLGVPFNIASYALLAELLAYTHGFEKGEVVGDFGDLHVYLPHRPAAEEQLARELRPLPTLRITNRRESILDYTLADFVLEGYNRHPKLEYPTPMFGGFF